MSSLEDVYDVGPVRSASLRDRGFDSIQDVALAPIADLTALEGVGPARARKIRYSARQLLTDRAAERGAERASPAITERLPETIDFEEVLPDDISLGDEEMFPTALLDALAACELPDRQEGYVTTRAVTAGDVAVVAPGSALLTAVGATDYPDLFDAASVSIPGRTFVDPWQEIRASPESTPTGLALEAAEVWVTPGKLAATAPDAYELLAEHDSVAGAGVAERIPAAVMETITGASEAVTEADQAAGDVASFPDATFLDHTVVAIGGDALLKIRERRPELERSLVALLTDGTVFLEGTAFDFENPHEVAVLDSAGVYLPGERVFPAGTLLPAGTAIQEGGPIQETAFLHPEVVSIPGDVAFDTFPDRAAAAEREPPSLPFLSRCGVLLPPGAVRHR